MITEFTFNDIVFLKQKGYDIKTIAKKLNQDFYFVDSVINHAKYFKLPDFRSLEKEFHKSLRMIRSAINFDFASLRHIELITILIVGLQGSGKTVTAEYLFKKAKNFYRRKRLSVKTVFSNSLAYNLEHIPNADVFCSGIDDSDELQDSADHFKRSNKKAIQKLWMIRHIPEWKFNRTNGIIFQIFNTHQYYTLNKRIREQARFVIFKNVLANKKANMSLKLEIDDIYYDFLKQITDWRIIHPIFAKFGILKFLDECFFLRIPYVIQRIPQIRIDPESSFNTNEEMLNSIILRMLALESKTTGRNPLSWAKIKEMIRNQEPYTTWKNRLQNKINDIKEDHKIVLNSLNNGQDPNPIEQVITQE